VSLKELPPYTKQQWALIDAAVERAAKTTHHEIQSLRPHGLTSEDRALLASFRWHYAKMASIAATPRSRPSARDLKRVRRIAWLCGELRKELNNVHELEARTILTASCGEVLRLVEEYAKLTERVCWELDQDHRKFLTERGFFHFQEKGIKLKPRYWLTPLGNYYLGVLSLWIKIGGEMRYSRVQGTLSGPLVEFVEAVANPVLGEFAYKRNSLQDILDLARRGVFRFEQRH
jgi:hypothetical protein